MRQVDTAYINPQQVELEGYRVDDGHYFTARTPTTTRAQTMANKLLKKASKFFRVALEGATTDGREIAREWIVQMAANFDPVKYGARIWLEHLRGTLPDSPFKAYGDVIALKAEEVVIDGVKKMALFAQISPTEDLIKLSKARQKIYTSCEIHTKFADSGQAYLVGLGITDTPASLGTEVLAFAAQNPEANPLQGRKSSPETLFSELTEVALEFTDAPESEAKSLTEKVKGLLAKFTAKKSDDDTRFTDINQAVEALLNHVVALSEQTTEASKDKARIEKLETDLAQAVQNHNALKTQLENEDGNQSTRQQATGGNGKQLTDC